MTRTRLTAHRSFFATALSSPCSTDIARDKVCCCISSEKPNSEQSSLCMMRHSFMHLEQTSNRQRSTLRYQAWTNGNNGALIDRRSSHVIFCGGLLLRIL